jgi:hypothetical protein
LPSHFGLTPIPETEGAEHDQRAQRPERGDLAARVRHGLPILRRHQEGAEAVQQDVSPYPGPAAIRQGLRNLLRHRAVLIEVLGVRDRFVSGANGIQDGGKDLIAVQQQVHRVAPGDPRRRIGLDRRGEGRIRHRQVRQREVRLHSRAC